MINAHDQALYENAADAINQLKYNYRVMGASQMWQENMRILKTVTRKLGIPTNLIDCEANRLVFNERYSIYIYVLYYGKLPDSLEACGYNLKYSLPQCADHIRMVLPDCHYVLHYNQKTKTYWFYDQATNTKLLDFEDYANSLYFKDYMQNLVKTINISLQKNEEYLATNTNKD